MLCFSNFWVKVWPKKFIKTQFTRHLLSEFFEFHLDFWILFINLKVFPLVLEKPFEIIFRKIRIGKPEEDLSLNGGYLFCNQSFDSLFDDMGLDMEVDFKKVQFIEGVIFAINILKGLTMFLFVVLNSVAFLEEDFRLCLGVKTENGLLFEFDELVHAAKDVLDLIVDSAIDLSSTSVLQPMYFLFE